MEELNHHKTILTRLQEGSKSHNITMIEYDLPPAEFFYLADQRVLLATWYPFGKGEVSPCVLIENAQRGEQSGKILNHFMTSFEFITERSQKLKDQAAN